MNYRGELLRSITEVNYRGQLQRSITEVNYKEIFQNLYILSILCLSVWVFVCFYPINVKTAEPIGPNGVRDLIWPREGSWMIEFLKICLIKFDFGKFFKSAKFFLKNPRTFLFLFYNVQYRKESVQNWKKMGAKRLKA